MRFPSAIKTLESLPPISVGIYFIDMSRDPRFDSISDDVKSLKHKADSTDESFKRLEAKIESLDKDLKVLLGTVGEIKGSWSTAKVVMTTALAILALVGIGVYINSLNNTFNSHGERLAKLETSLIDIKELLRPDSWKKIASSSKEQLKQSLPEVKKLIEQIQEKKAAPTTEVVGMIGEKLVEVARDNTDPEAAKNSWEYAVKLASYRSKLNATGDSSFDPRTLASQGLHIISNSAKIELPPRRHVELSGKIEDITLSDSLIRMKSPFTLKNVKFINCAFEIPQSSETERLLIAIFKELSVTVNAG